MLINPRTVREVASEIADASAGAIESYKQDEAAQEPEITGRMLGAIADRFRSKCIGGINWNAKTLRTARGASNEEGRHGADFLVVLDIQMHNFAVKKGFLAQAKRAEPGTKLGPEDWNRLSRQCTKMLEVTAASFVVAYSKQCGIRYFPAIDIVGSSRIDLFEHYDRGVQAFFELFLECFIGDGRLDKADIGVLDALHNLPVDYVLELKGGM